MGTKGLTRLLTGLSLSLLLAAGAARAQELAPAPVDSQDAKDAKDVTPPVRAPAAIAPSDASGSDAGEALGAPNAPETDDQGSGAPMGRPASSDASPAAPLGTGASKGPHAPKPASMGPVKAEGTAKNGQASTPPPSGAKRAEKRKGPRPLLTPKVSDEDVLATWERWKRALTELDMKAADQEGKDLVQLKEDLGIEALEPISDGLLRAALVRRSAKDTVGAVQLSRFAVDLSPNLPYAHLSLAEALLLDAPFSPMSYLGELGNALKLLWTEPRYSRAAFMDLGASVLFAVTATATVLLFLLFFKRLRYFLHDFHHLLPRAAARWQAASLALLILSLPLVFRLGVAPVLLALFAAVTLYVGPLERVLAGILLLLLVVVPFAGGLLAQKTAFAGTDAEEVYQLEHGGLEAARAAVHVRQRISEEKAEFPELFALGRYLERRGKVDEAITLFKQAADGRPNHARLLVNLANALLTRGEVDNAAEIYQTATVADPTLAAAFFNLAKLRYRRANSMTDDSVGMELSQAQTALSSAHSLDPTLLFRADPQGEALLANRLLLSPPLPAEELLALAESDPRAARVGIQLGARLLGDLDLPLAAGLMAGLTMLLTGLGFLRARARLAKPCDKCGRPVCRRCDPDLSAASGLCNQCVHVYRRANAVPPPIRVRKQIEVQNFRSRMNRTAYVLGALLSGTGHVFSGFPARGVVYLFCFLFLAAGLLFPQGVLRVPYGPGPVWLRLIPTILLLSTVYARSLRGLFRKQAG